jgi:hypothetical protein
MRLGDLPAWGVPGQFVAYDAEAPLGRSVHTEQPMRERQVLGPSWRQALQMNALAKRAEIDDVSDRRSQTSVAQVPT